MKLLTLGLLLSISTLLAPSISSAGDIFHPEGFDTKNYESQTAEEENLDAQVFDEKNFDSKNPDNQRRTGEFDCSDDRVKGCDACGGTRICCPSQECTVSNCPSGRYCPNDKGGGSHCC